MTAKVYTLLALRLPASSKSMASVMVTGTTTHTLHHGVRVSGCGLHTDPNKCRAAPANQGQTE
jgi:hypothetical protein